MSISLCVREPMRWFYQNNVSHTYSQEGVQSSILHELSEDHDGAAGCNYAFQVDNVGMLELAHD